MGGLGSKHEAQATPATNNLVLVGSTKSVPEKVVEGPQLKVITKPDDQPQPIVYAGALRGDLITKGVSNIIPGFT